MITMPKANGDLYGLVETEYPNHGSPTLAGVQRLWALVDDIKAVLVGHHDNTGAPCRIDLRGHDCCYTCNAVEDMLRATLEYFDEIQQGMRRQWDDGP